MDRPSDQQRIGVSTEPFDGTARPGTVRVRTYGEALAGYLGHPKPKSLGPSGEPSATERPGSCATGLSRRSARRSTSGRATSSKSASVDWRPVPRTVGRSMSIPDGTRWTELVLPLLATMDRRELVARSGLSRRTIEEVAVWGRPPPPEA